MKNKLTKFKRVIVNVFFFNDKLNLKKPQLQNDSFERDKRKRPNKIDKHRLERYKYLKEGDNIKKMLTVEEIFILGGEDCSQRGLTHMREALKELEELEIVKRLKPDDRKNKWLWGLNDKNLLIKAILKHPNVRKGIFKARPQFELKMNNREAGKIAIKNTAKIVHEFIDEEDKELSKEVLENWENQERMAEILKDLT